MYMYNEAIRQLFTHIVINFVLYEYGQFLNYVYTRTQYDPDMSLTGNAKICCLGLILALF